MQNIKNIIFDYGNVIFLIDFLKTQNSFTELGIQNVETFFAHTGHNPIFDQFEQGDIAAPEFRDGIRKITGQPELSDEQIDKAWTSLLIGVPPINHELLLKAKSQYRIFLLSNINEIHLDFIEKYLKREFNIDSNDQFFEKVYYSHLVGIRKPRPEIFELVIKENNLKVEETLFIDDSPQHLKTAQALGLQTHLITNEESLEKFLYSSGLLKK
ncbi:Haloacid dehalogenase-like hydrolase [Arcticibacter svalbardensis MN12-7]|uniref:Haloacid dehalogenase-like hydrolase n=1 Tax=Arcticibacter svalbardensis MN12-7 TaxID=1150600 RepID=R9GSD6_9SPHI|nr:HAD family phosphatase [Arcticibacter svalbardensis]EOR94475.1 Haloacid dehalogenase-like hydrolase [Arcticibacter svalbardensis MN12-7]